MSKISIAYPATGLSPAISVINMATEIQDFSGVMTEIGTSKVYVYEFTEAEDTDYVYVITTTGYDTVSGALFYEASGGAGGGLTTEEHDKLLSLSNVGGGGTSINIQGIQRTITNASDSIVKEMTKNHNQTLDKFNETNSHIELVKTDISDKIESIDIPDTDLSTVNGSIGTLKSQFTKLSEWIKKKDDKEKSEELAGKEDEYSSVLSDIEKEYKTLLSSKEIEIDTLKKDLEESRKKEDGYEAMVDVLEEEIQETKDKVEKETKENLIKTISTL